MPLLAFTTTIPSTPEADPPAGIPPLGWKTPLAALVSYLGALTVATYPYITSFLTDVPGLGDPLIHQPLIDFVVDVHAKTRMMLSSGCIVTTACYIENEYYVRMI